MKRYLMITRPKAIRQSLTRAECIGEEFTMRATVSPKYWEIHWVSSIESGYGHSLGIITTDEVEEHFKEL